jgi:hypothetical protein
MRLRETGMMPVQTMGRKNCAIFCGPDYNKFCYMYSQIIINTNKYFEHYKSNDDYTRLDLPIHRLVHKIDSV